MRLSLTLLLPLFLLMQNSCIKKDPITTDYVNKHLGFLASDELRGRRTFSPEIAVAEEYIAQAFKEAGLGIFQDNEAYLQRFELLELSVQEKHLSLNGQEIEAQKVAVQTTVENLEWTDSADVIVTYILDNDDFGEEWGRFRRNNDNLLVIVHPKHKQAFQRYTRWLNRPNRLFEFNTGRSMVMVLSDIEIIEHFSLKTVTKTSKQNLRNVVGVIEGERADEYVLFSAHHDHLGVRNRRNQEDSIYNGANDDASGTVAVMALANYFGQQPKPERSLIFVTFTAEEIGGYGSRYFSNQVEPTQIVAMFNIEMIGKPAVLGPNTAWITGWDKSDFGQILQESTKGSQYEFYADPYPEQNLFYRSDNATLARLGVPAHSISTSPIDDDPDYHRSSDELATLEIDHLTNTIKAITKGAEKIISGELTPKRVDPASL